MSLWTEEEFQRIAGTTKLSARTLLGCHDVLVDGMAGVDVAALHGLFPAQISRGIAGLREKQAKLEEIEQVKLQAKEAEKSFAVEAARVAVGKNLKVEDAEPGWSYEGAGIVQVGGFLVQKVGRIGVVHDLGKLQLVPKMNVSVTIEYPHDGKLAVVSEVKVQAERSGVDRRSTER